MSITPIRIADGLGLNARALHAAEALVGRADELRLCVTTLESGGRLIDCGASAGGGLSAGLGLARVCLSELGHVSLRCGEIAELPCTLVDVFTDHPVAACLASQYAGWQISAGKFFAMGSGPMRAAAGKEGLFERIGFREQAIAVVGVLECRKPPTEEVVALIAESCGVAKSNITLLFAPTASLAGTVQIVARSIETALHKLVELGFDVSRIVAGAGSAPLPPVGRDDLESIGRTNDAILYGARVILHVRGDDESLEDVVNKVPSSSSRDFGQPFTLVFARYNHDFYAVDPLLFSPAEIVLQNLDTGNSFAAGRLRPDILRDSFFGNHVKGTTP